MKKTVIAALIAVGLAAGIAYAHGNGSFTRGGHHMMGPGMMGSGMMGSGAQMMQRGYCPGAGGYGMSQGMHNQDFLDATASLRKEMHDKRFQLMEARRTPQTTQAEIARLQEDIIELRSRIDAEAQKYAGPAQ